MQVLQQISTWVLALCIVSILARSRRLASFCVFPLLVCMTVLVVKFDCTAWDRKVTSLLVKGAVLAALLAAHAPIPLGAPQVLVPLAGLLAYTAAIDIEQIYGCPALSFRQTAACLVLSGLSYGAIGVAQTTRARS
jgi:hypothetical protein